MKGDETNLVDSTKQRHELAEQGGAQTGDVDEGTLGGGGQTRARLKRAVHDRQQQALE